MISYNQEEFIEEAVRGALAQTYSPLEIVISDDCSPDNTFVIIEEIIDCYDGPHKVIIHKNTTNLGLAGNINKVWELASGEFLVIQAGDDISLAERTEKLVCAWQSTLPKPDIVYSNITIIDENSNAVSERLIVNPVNVTEATEQTLTGERSFVIGGCAAGYSRELHDKVGPLDNNVIAEDFIYSFRALLGNGIVGVPEALVMYRQNDESIMGNFRDGGIKKDCLLKGEQAKLLEYNKAMDAYGFSQPYLRWRLSRRITAVDRQTQVSQSSFIKKLYFLLWALVTGRLRLAKEIFGELRKNIRNNAGP